MRHRKRQKLSEREKETDRRYDLKKMLIQNREKFFQPLIAHKMKQNENYNLRSTNKEKNSATKIDTIKRVMTSMMMT